MTHGDIEPQSVRNLDDERRQWIPSIEVRMYRRIGDSVRIWVLVKGLMPEYPWVRITEATEAGYVGVTVGDYEFTPGFRVPQGTVITFTADNIIEY